MALPTIAGIARVTLDWHTEAGGTFANVLHFHRAAGDEDDVFAALGSNLTNEMVAAMAPTCHLVNIDILLLDGASSTHHYPLDGTYKGTGSGEPLYQVCAIVSLYTGLRGPRHRGRIFLPCVGESNTANGLLNTVDQTEMQGGWEDFVAAMSADSTLLQVTSYEHADSEDVTAVAVQQVTGTQRRRMRQLH